MEINWESKVLSSLAPVIENSEEVVINNDEIKNVARWMAYEEFILPQNNKLRKDPEDFIRTTFLINTLNFAFTDFNTSIKYSIQRDGSTLSDSEAMFRQIHEAIDSGINLLDGKILANLTIDELGKIFSGNIEMPMMAERVEILNSVGTKLCDDFSGDWLNFINEGPKKLYHKGEGLIERLIVEFPRFDDKSTYQEIHEINFYKLAQLAFWGIHAELAGSKYFVVEDMTSMSAFADYIVPVALEVMKITHYSKNLKEKIMEGKIIERDSQEEIEIRAASLFATAKLTEEINKRRNKDEQLIIPQLDYRIWKQYHATHRPHHLTVTTMY
tara:strand:- start:2400 stop:3383 length:984 start_codon:yes stop_codon:yes gene_type:complete